MQNWFVGFFSFCIDLVCRKWMANKEDEGFYHSLSRKELQSLCKKYGLPANRSSSDMAKSLAPYLEVIYWPILSVKKSV